MTDSRRSLSQQLGKYQLVATLGQGGMGTVYLALASGFGEFRKLLVLKELRQDLTRQHGFVSMFMDEAKLAARLAHPNVVQTFEASEVGERYFLAMEYLDGQSLATLLDRVGELNATVPLWMHLQILCDTLAGLHYAHELLDYDGSSLQVVHRDVSPQNVFVTYHGQVKVVDFGVAKVANAGVKTEPGMFVGKFGYAAPEQVRGSPVDRRTDVFAVGIMLWEAIAGRPFAGQPPTPASCRARCLGLEPRISEIIPEIDPLLARICDRALAVHLEDRFDSAWDFRTELQDYMQHSGVRVEPAEIGQLMHDAFNAERRTMHVRIEQAMRNTDLSASLADDLSEFQHDKAPTTVADLSSLVEISLERDDQKIQQEYAHSKVRLAESSGQKRGVGMSKLTRSQWVRPTAFTAVCVAALAGGWALLRDRSAEDVRVQSLETTTTHNAATAPPAVATTPPPAPPAVEALDPATINPSNNAPAPSLQVPSAPERTSRSNRASKQQLSAATPSASNSGNGRSRNRASSNGPMAAVEPAESAPAASANALPGPGQRRIEEGADLTFIRREPVRIDRESPYR